MRKSSSLLTALLSARCLPASSQLEVVTPAGICALRSCLTGRLRPSLQYIIAYRFAGCTAGKPIFLSGSPYPGVGILFVTNNDDCI